MYIYCDESAASPLIISISPSLKSPPFTRLSRREWVCERGGALKQPGLAACDEAHTWSEWSLITAAVLYAECASPLETVSFPVHARWFLVGPGRSVERRGPHPRDGWRAGCRGRTPGSAAGPKEDEAADRSHRPRTRTQGGARAATGLRPLPGPFLPEHCPSFTTRAARRGHQIPCLFGHLIPFGHFILLFLFNKSLSEAWRHTHCVCRLLLPSQWWRMRARRSLDSAVGQHRWRHPLSLAKVHGNPHWDGGTTETASQPPNG